MPSGWIRYGVTHVLGIPLLLAGLALAAQHSGLDVALSQMFYDIPTGVFPMRRAVFLEMAGHRFLLALPIVACVIALGMLWVCRKDSALRVLRNALILFLLSMALTPITISQLKHLTTMPRPFNATLFGGQAPMDVTFWRSVVQKAGHALPSNHAGAGYSLMTLYFFGWAVQNTTLRWAGLALGILAGLSFSIIRIMQGAHFLSQTIWSACVVWLIASLAFAPLLIHSRARGHTPLARKSHP